MTRESPERSEGVSDSRTGSEATRETSEDDERSEEADARADGGGADPASMLDISGHEDRERPGEEDAPFGDDADADADVDASADGDAGPYPDAADAAAEIGRASCRERVWTVV